MISLRGGGSTVRFRITSGSRHSITGGGGGSSSANFSPIVEKYEFIKAAFSLSSSARLSSSLFKGPMDE